MVDEVFFSTVPGLNFDMCTISTLTKTQAYTPCGVLFSHIIHELLRRFRH